MNWQTAETLILDAGRFACGFTANWLLQSTLLIAAGLLMAGLLRRKGSAVQSVIYRTTLIAALMCPAASVLLSLAGFSGWTLNLPVAWTYLDPPPTIADFDARATTSDDFRSAADAEPARSGASQPASERVFSPVQVSDTRIATNEPGSPEKAIRSAAVADSPRAPFPRETSSAAVPELRIHPIGGLFLGFCLLWWTVSAVLFGRLARSWRRLAALRRCGIPADTDTVRTCREVAQLLQVTVPDVISSPYFSSPCLAGLRRPAVLLPDSALNFQLRDVLVHELAHLRRRDCHWQLMSHVATSLFFFQPLLWRLAHCLEATAEEVCDDYVVQFGGNRQQYANQLVDIAERNNGSFAPAGVGIVNLRTMLAVRVIRILDSSRALSTRAGRSLFAVVLLGGSVGTIVTGFVGAGGRMTARAEIAPSAAAKEIDGEPTERTSQVDTASRPENVGKEPQDASAPQVEKKVEPPPGNELRGRVLGADGKLVAGAKLYWFRSRVHDIEPIAPRLVATTNRAGEFSFVSAGDGSVDPAEPAGWRYHEHLVITAPGHGFAATSPGVLRRQAQPSENVIGTVLQTLTGNSIPTVRLPPAGETLRGQFVDIDGQPVVGATVRIRWYSEIAAPHAGRRNQSETDARTALNMQVHQLLRVIEPVQLREVLPAATTDSEGRFELRDLGADRLFQLLVQGDRIEATTVVARNQPGETIPIAPDKRSREPGCTLHPREFLLACGPSKPVIGQVLDMENGKPIASAVVRAYQVHGDRLNSSREREQFAVRTDHEGRFRITGLPIGPENRLVAFTVGEEPYIPVGRQVDTSANPVVEQNIRLKRGVWAEGRVFDGHTDQPFVGEISYYHFRDRALEQQIPGLLLAYLDGRYSTNSKGEFRVPVMPSRGVLAFRYSGSERDRDGIDRFPRGAGADAIAGSEDLGGTRVFPTLPHYLTPSSYERLAEVAPAAGAGVVRVDMPLYASKPVKIRVVNEKGERVEGCRIYGANERWGWQEKGGDFQVEDLKQGERRKVFAFHRAQNLAGGVFIEQDASQPVELKLVAAGSVSGRLVDGDGDPITDASLQVDYEKLSSDDRAAIWANGPGLVVNPNLIPVDDRGRFVLDGLIPGWSYYGYASAPRKLQGEMMVRFIGRPLQGVQVNPGERKELGDLVVQELESEVSETAPRNDAETEKHSTSNALVGQILGVDNLPASGVHVAIIGEKMQIARGGDFASASEVLAESVTNDEGRWELSVPDVSAKTHSHANLIARKDGVAVAWRAHDLKHLQLETPLRLSLDEPIRGRLVNLEGQAASGVRLLVRSVMRRGEPGQFSDQGAMYDGRVRPAAWFPPIVSDETGRFTIRGVPARHGVLIDVEGNDQFAPQEIALNTGMAEERGERDATYRSLVKNTEPGVEAVLALAPAQLFEGVIRYDDTGEGVSHARLAIWSSQQAEGGSMVAVGGTADAQGRFRLNPKPGVRFDLTAYPPGGTPYLARRTVKAIRWEAGDRFKHIDLTLPRGVLVRGRVQNARTKTPLSHVSVQYVPESASNSDAASGILTGWQAIQVSDAAGRFEIAALPGPGWLIAHAPDKNFVLKESSSTELSRGKKGGQRYYAHAFVKVDPRATAESIEVTIDFQPGARVSGKILDPHQKPVAEAIVISRLAISPHSMFWRGHQDPVLGGRFDVSGLEQEVEYPTYFLDARRQLGATAILHADEPEPTVVLQPCGSAAMRFIDSQGSPVPEYSPNIEMVVRPGCYRFDTQAMRSGELAADSDFIANIDRVNHWKPRKSDAAGKIVVPALVPGAAYQLIVHRAGRNHVVQKFQPKSGQIVDLGDIVVEPTQ